MFQIEIFNKPMLAYFPGEMVEGVVHVQVGSQKESVCKGIKIKLRGKSFVQWTEAGILKATTYTAEQTYCDYKVYLLGTGDREIAIPPGRNQLPFRFLLPNNLPSSFIKTDGKVEYELEANIVKGILTANKRAKVQFTVNNLLDLNLQPRLDVPVEFSKSKTVCCLCCKKGAISYSVTFPRTGYASGEFIRFTGEFRNDSEKVNTLTASIYQKVAFYVKSKTKTSKKLLIEVEGPSVEIGDSVLWNCQNLQIPPLPPTALGGTCGSIDVQYFVEIGMSPSGMSIPLTKEIPITIGSVPLRSAFSEIAWNQANAQYRNSNIFHKPQFLLHSYNYPNLPPLTFRETKLPNSSDRAEEEHENQSFQHDHGRPSSSYAAHYPDPNSIPLQNVKVETASFKPKYITYG